MNVVLVMFRENGERRSFSLSRDVTVVGRREDADFRVPLTDVSRKHCRLIKDGNILLLEDLGSANGTYHNGRRVQEAEVQPGDTLRIGPVQFIVQIDGVPDEQELGGNTSSGLADSAATIVTPAVVAPPPLPPDFAPPPLSDMNQATVDEGPVDYAEDSAIAADELADQDLAPPADAELVAESIAEESPVSDMPVPEELPDPDLQAPSAAPAPAAPMLQRQPTQAEESAEAESFDFINDSHESVAGEDDVMIDFDLPDDPKR